MRLFCFEKKAERASPSTQAGAERQTALECQPEAYPIAMVAVRFLRVICLLVGAIRCASAAEVAFDTESEPAEHLVFRTWRTEVGLPHNTINRILQTSDG